MGLNGRVWRIRAFTALTFVLLSIFGAASLALGGFPPFYNPLSKFAFVTVAVGWLGIPGTILGWIHLKNIRRSGDQRGIYAALVAAVAWPCALISACLVVAGVACLEMGLSIPHSQSLLPAPPASFWFVTLFLIYTTFRLAHKWSTHGPTLREFIDAYRRRIFAVTPLFLTISHVWVLLGFATLVEVERRAMYAYSANHRANIQQGNPLSDIEIESVEQIGNVIVLSVKPLQLPTAFTPYYAGPSLQSAAENLVYSSYPGERCYFPNDPIANAIELDERTSTIELPFALPSVDDAIACKRKIERLERRKTAPAGAIELFQIQSADGRGYSATLAPAIAGSATSETLSPRRLVPLKPTDSSANRSNGPENE